MQCMDFSTMIDAYLEGRLEKPELNDFAEHLIECEKCETELFAAALTRH